MQQDAAIGLVFYMQNNFDYIRYCVKMESINYYSNLYHPMKI